MGIVGKVEKVTSKILLKEKSSSIIGQIDKDYVPIPDLGVTNSSPTRLISAMLKPSDFYSETKSVLDYPTLGYNNFAKTKSMIEFLTEDFEEFTLI